MRARRPIGLSAQGTLSREPSDLARGALGLVVADPWLAYDYLTHDAHALVWDVMPERLRLLQRSAIVAGGLVVVGSFAVLGGLLVWWLHALTIAPLAGLAFAVLFVWGRSLLEDWPRVVEHSGMIRHPRASAVAALLLAIVAALELYGWPRRVVALGLVAYAAAAGVHVWRVWMAHGLTQTLAITNDTVRRDLEQRGVVTVHVTGSN